MQSREIFFSLPAEGRGPCRDGAGEQDDGRGESPAVQLALIKAWQHSPCPTALFMLSGRERARAAFPNLVLASICPGSLAALGEWGRMGKGSQPLPSAAGQRGGMGSSCGSSPRGVWPL